MSGLPTPQRSQRSGAPTDTCSVKHKYKQLVRILLHLRDELHPQRPQLAMPTSSMLEHLVFNCPLSVLQGEHWQQVIDQTVDYFVSHLDPLSRAGESFRRCDVDESLFPNEELFDAQDAYLFATALREHLQDLR